jgi:flavin reductase (DIM6/NTAB) family NADH-FMN oxidoreductase RutF
MAKRAFPMSEVYRLLEPGPVVLLSTTRQGKANVMAMSWHTMMDFEPPIVGCVVSNRDFTFNTLKSTKECVINIPTVELAKKVVACGNSSGRNLDKFKAFRLTAEPASRVGAPLIKECYASLECKVIDASMATRLNFFILQVVKAWVDRLKPNPRTIHHRGRGVFMVAGKTIRLRSKMK